MTIDLQKIFSSKTSALDEALKLLPVSMEVKMHLKAIDAYLQATYATNLVELLELVIDLTEIVRAREFRHGEEFGGCGLCPWEEPDTAPNDSHHPDCIVGQVMVRVKTLEKGLEETS